MTAKAEATTLGKGISGARRLAHRLHSTKNGRALPPNPSRLAAQQADPGTGG